MKKILTLLLLLSNLISWGDSWIQKANFAAGNIAGQASFSIGGKGYFAAGADNTTFFQDLWEYDPSTNVWTQKASMPFGIRSNPVGFSIGSKGYVGMGYGMASLFYSDFWEYDPVINSWTQKANYPGAGGVGLSGCVGFSIGNKGFIGTGAGWAAGNLEDSNEFWEYDPSTNTWTQKANFGGFARWGAVGFSIGNKGYIGTGVTGNLLPDVYFNDFWEYDPLIDSWTQKANFSGLPRSSGAGFSIGSKGYIGTGNSASSEFKDFHEYDQATNVWTQKANYPGGGGLGIYAGGGFSIGANGYMGGGCAPSSIAKQDFWQYTPDSTTGVIDINNSNFGINIFPNPFSVSAKMKFERELSNAELKLFDTYGNEIKSYENINNDELVIYIDNLPGGIYYYQLIERQLVIGRGKLEVQ